MSRVYVIVKLGFESCGALSGESPEGQGGAGRASKVARAPM